MGVNGLWTVIQPCARPTNLATLNRKRLAVDASIWIYQFLKAVRDKEGNALRNSHVVGFFRRICKLLWFGILPVFVFDGGAPALKRATIQSRARRREGRRDDAVRTAGKLLAVQMQRLAEDDRDMRRREQERDVTAREEVEQEEIPDASKLVYVDEIGMSQQERLQTRKFQKQDAYHLPELDGGIAAMGKPDDPRIMSVEELEEYARQFHDGEDVNLYDFSKIDFNGDFFKSLPPPDRYNILNAARVRSRLRMGLSKEQLDEMFPDRMAFSRFQIERVKERNHLTQRLMYEVGMTGTDLTVGVNARVAGEKDREYILVKNDGVEGGWALGVVSKEKDIGEAHKPIDVDAIDIQYQTKNDEDEDEDDFEDVPIEGLNRLPKPTQFTPASVSAAEYIAAQRQQFFETDEDNAAENEDVGETSLFVSGNTADADDLFEEQPADGVHPEEEHDLNLAIAMSLKNQHDFGDEESEAEEDFEDVPVAEPEWTQKSTDAPKPIRGGGGSMIAHIVNNRASAAVPKRQEAGADGSDSEEDLQTVLAKSRKTKQPKPKPVVENKKNPFDGPLPFPKLDWGSSLFAKKSAQRGNGTAGQDGDTEHHDDVDMAGGFEPNRQDDGPKPLPPWMADETDIRESIKKQQDAERDINAEDRQQAEEDAMLRRREMRHQLIEVESSSDSGSDVEVLEHRPTPKKPIENTTIVLDDDQTQDTPVEDEPIVQSPPKDHSATTTPAAAEASPEPAFAGVQLSEVTSGDQAPDADSRPKSASPEPEFEDVQPAEPGVSEPEKQPSQVPILEDVPVVGMKVVTRKEHAPGQDDDDLFADAEYEEFSDPEDEELMVQMAEEAEEHARFASELNSKCTRQSKEDYEKELKALRSQQQKDRRDADEVTQVMVSECQALLRLFGIPYVTAPMEAEAQCAELVKLGLVDGIVTDDSDTFLFGGTRVYKNMFNGNKFVECYLGQDLDKEMSLSREQLISLAQLLGSDYTEGLPGVGPVTAVEILSEFPGQSGLENFREWWKGVQSHPKEADVSSAFRRKFRKSQGTKLFLPPGFPSLAVYDAYLHPDVDDSPEPFQWGVPDLEGLRRFLMATIGWSQERTDEVLVPVIKDMNRRGVEGTQSNITRFFGGGVGVGAKEAFTPRQRAQGSKRMAAAVDRLRANTNGEPATVETGEPSKRRRTAARAEVVPDEDEDVVDGGDQAEASTSKGKGKGNGKGKRKKAS